LELEGQPLILRTTHRLEALTDDLIVVTNDRERYKSLDLPARLVPDLRRGEGALMGVYSGLLAARHPHALVVGCDMPFLNLPLLRYLVSLVNDADVIVPRLDGYLEPLHAIYAKTCLPYMADLLNRGRRQIIGFFDQVKVCYVEQELSDLDPHRLSFLNINTPADWLRVQELVAQDVPGTR
jgi:molybdopterin-guanine dinucleotide biosynthesis protein A